MIGIGEIVFFVFLWKIGNAFSRNYFDLIDQENVGFLMKNIADGYDRGCQFGDGFRYRNRFLTMRVLLRAIFIEVLFATSVFRIREVHPPC